MAFLGGFMSTNQLNIASRHSNCQSQSHPTGSPKEPSPAYSRPIPSPSQRQIPWQGAGSRPSRMAGDGSPAGGHRRTRPRPGSQPGWPAAWRRGRCSAPAAWSTCATRCRARSVTKSSGSSPPSGSCRRSPHHSASITCVFFLPMSGKALGTERTGNSQVPFSGPPQRGPTILQHHVGRHRPQDVGPSELHAGHKVRHALDGPMLQAHAECFGLGAWWGGGLTQKAAEAQGSTGSRAQSANDSVKAFLY